MHHLHTLVWNIANSDNQTWGPELAAVKMDWRQYGKRRCHHSCSLFHLTLLDSISFPTESKRQLNKRFKMPTPWAQCMIYFTLIQEISEKTVSPSTGNMNSKWQQRVEEWGESFGGGCLLDGEWNQSRREFIGGEDIGPVRIFQLLRVWSIRSDVVTVEWRPEWEIGWRWIRIETLRAVLPDGCFGK